MPDRPRYRRWTHPFQDHPALKALFDQALLDIGAQITARQARRGLTQQQIVDAAQPHMSARGLRSILKAQSDPKVSTLVRLAAVLGCDVRVVILPRTGSALP